MRCMIYDNNVRRKAKPMFPQYIRAYRGAKKSHQVQYEQQRPVASQVVHTHRTSCRPCLAERVWCTHKFQSSLLNFYFRLSVFQSSLLPIYFRDGPNRCSLCAKVWDKTYPICEAPLSRSTRRSFSPLQKSRHHNRSCV